VTGPERYVKLAEEFLQWLRHNRGRAERTASAYRLALDRLGKFAGDRDPLELGREDLDLFTGAWLFKQLQIGPRGRRTYVAAVREFFKWLYQAKLLDRNPAASIEYPDVGRRLPRVITLANAEKLMWAPNFNTFEGVRDGAILGLLAGCGIRVSGLVMMNQGDVLEDSMDGHRRLNIRVKEKGNRERLVPVPREADMLLRIYLEHPELKSIDRDLPTGDRVLFISLRNRSCPPHEYHGERRRLNRRSVNEMILRYGTREGIALEQLHPHAMRHLYGTELKEEDVPDSVAQMLLGHMDPKSTAIYTHTAMRKLTREADRANPLSKMKTPVTDLLKQLGKP